MSVIRVEHTDLLKGEIDVQGSKNAILPMLAASIINKGHTVIYGCPDIADVRSTIDILNYIGCKTSYAKGKIEIDSREINKCCIPQELSGKLRSSIVFMGAMLSRKEEISIAYPGGCSIGARPLDIHIQALSELNIVIRQSDKEISAVRNKIKGNRVTLKFPSVGATQNLLMCAVIAEGTTIIENYAKEPEIYEFCDFLRGMGANIRVEKDCLVVIGVERLHDSVFCLKGDRIVAGTYLFMTALVSGDLTLTNIVPWQISDVVNKLSRAGCKLVVGDNCVTIHRNKGDKINSLSYVSTEPFPGFSTDLQAFMTVLMSVTEGVTVIEENIFENRFHTAYELAGMGANIDFISNKLIRINGVSKLNGSNVVASDLRDGAALIMAGLFANNETEVSNAHIINRGYEDIVRDLRILGAGIRYSQES